MLTAKYKGRAIVTSGEIKEGDVYPDFCCQGHGWEVFLLIPDYEPKGVGIWGVCLNEGICPSASPIQPEDKRSSIEAEDFWEWLANQWLKAEKFKLCVICDGVFEPHNENEFELHCCTCQKSLLPCRQCGSDDTWLHWLKKEGLIWIAECGICEFKITGPDPKVVYKQFDLRQWQIEIKDGQLSFA